MVFLGIKLVDFELFKCGYDVQCPRHMTKSLKVTKNHEVLVYEVYESP